MGRKKISRYAVKIEADEESRIVYESFYWYLHNLKVKYQPIECVPPSFRGLTALKLHLNHSAILQWLFF